MADKEQVYWFRWLSKNISMAKAEFTRHTHFFSILIDFLLMETNQISEEKD